MTQSHHQSHRADSLTGRHNSVAHTRHGSGSQTETVTQTHTMGSEPRNVGAYLLPGYSSGGVPVYTPQSMGVVSIGRRSTGPAAPSSQGATHYQNVLSSGAVRPNAAVMQGQTPPLHPRTSATMHAMAGGFHESVHRGIPPPAATAPMAPSRPQSASAPGSTCATHTVTKKDNISSIGATVAWVPMHKMYDQSTVGEPQQSSCDSPAVSPGGGSLYHSQHSESSGATSISLLLDHSDALHLSWLLLPVSTRARP